MPLDRVQPLKLEDPTTGGDDVDLFPTACDRNEDYLDCRGVTVQSDTSDDDAVVLARDASDNLTFQDASNPTPKTLSDLVAGTGGITEAGHKALRDLIHFIDGGPADGWTSGTYKEVLGSPFPTQEIWWTSTEKTHKIVSLDITRNASQQPTQEVWKAYALDGSTALVTVTDAISYTGPFETSRTRTWI